MPIPATDEPISPQEFAAVERALERLDRSDIHTRILAFASQWLFVVNLYQDMEARYSTAAEESRDRSRQSHRAILTLTMALGEAIAHDMERSTENNDRYWGNTVEAVSANLEWLRDKYQMWYCPMDGKMAADVLGDAFGNQSAV
jgi:hypothetical protein